MALLGETWPFLHIDGRAAGVDLPEALRGPSVTLQIGYDMPLPIPDLTVDDAGVRCTLSFRRTPHFCIIPWKAIYAFSDVDGRNVVFPDDVPPEVATAQAKANTPAPPAATGSLGARPDIGPKVRPEIGPKGRPEIGPEIGSENGSERGPDIGPDIRPRKQPPAQAAPAPRPAPTPRPTEDMPDEAAPPASSPSPTLKSGKPRPSHLKLV